MKAILYYCRPIRRKFMSIGLCSCLSENSLPKLKSVDTKVDHSVLAMKSGERESSSVPSSSPSSSSTSSSLITSKEQKTAPVIVPLIKPSAGRLPNFTMNVIIECCCNAATRFTHGHIIHDLYYVCMWKVQGQQCGYGLWNMSIHRSHVNSQILNNSKLQNIKGCKKSLHLHYMQTVVINSLKLVFCFFPTVEDVQNVQIVCVWCQKEGVKRYSLCMGSELKSFCSEKCFAACRRAYFKRNKVSGI